MNEVYIGLDQGYLRLAAITISLTRFMALLSDTVMKTHSTYPTLTVIHPSQTTPALISLVVIMFCEIPLLS